MIFHVDKKILKEALTKLSYFFSASSGEWANLVSIIVKSRDGVSVIDLFTKSSGDSFQTLVPISVLCDHKDEEIVIDGALLVDIIKKSRGDTVVFEVSFETGTITISSEETEWVLPFLLKSIKRVKSDSEEILVNSDELLGALRRVKSAIGFDVGRPYLMMVKIANGKLQACDGFKFQETRISDKELDEVIPASAIMALIKLLESKGWQGQDFVMQSDSLITCLKSGVDKFCFVKPKAPFPDLTSMVVNPIKSKIPFLLTVNKKEIIDRIEQVVVLSNKKEPTITFELENQILTLCCDRGNGQKAKTEMSVNWSGPRKVLCFDIKSLLELLRAFNNDSIEIRLSKDKKDESGPIVMESDDTWSMLNQMKILK